MNSLRTIFFPGGSSSLGHYGPLMKVSEHFLHMVASVGLWGGGLSDTSQILIQKVTSVLIVQA